MTLRWCVLTGALMIAFVCATFLFSNVVANKPGVHTRWWDGTLERVDAFYPNGKPSASTTYGEDGTTVISLQEWTKAGALYHSKLRGEDGKVVEKSWSEDGKILLRESVAVGDESYLLAERVYYDDGKLQSEVYRTADGTVVSDAREFNDDGTLQAERHVLSNADQETKQYDNGKLVRREVFKANADQVAEVFYRNTEVVSVRTTRVALNRDSLTEMFNKDGTLWYSSWRAGEQSKSVLILYDHGKMIERQTLISFQLTTVEEFDPATGQIKRKIDVNESELASAVYLYRADGTLARMKTLNNDHVVTHQVDYDASGTKVVSEKDGGEAEPINPALLQNIPRPRQEN